MAQTEQLLLRLDADLKRLVTEIAANEDRSVAWIIRKALHDFCVNRPEASRLQTALTDPSAPLPPLYKRPPGRPAKTDPEWLEVPDAKRVLDYLEDPTRERLTQDEVFENTHTMPLAQASAGHHARLGNIMRAAGWIELIEDDRNGSEEVFWFRNDPRKSSEM
jgi:hypothetical protein